MDLARGNNGSPFCAAVIQPGLADYKAGSSLLLRIVGALHETDLMAEMFHTSGGVLDVDQISRDISGNPMVALEWWKDI